MLFTVAQSRKYRYIELAMEKELLELFFGQEASAVVVLEWQLQLLWLQGQKCTGLVMQKAELIQVHFTGSSVFKNS